MINQLVLLYSSSNNLVHMRFLIICLLGFTGFLRVSELAAIQIKDITFFYDYVNITIPKSKTDQLREGHIVHISKTYGLSCPVYWTDKYLKATNLITQPESYLICRLAKTKHGHNALGKHPLSYTRIRETFIQLLKPNLQRPRWQILRTTFFKIRLTIMSVTG